MIFVHLWWGIQHFLGMDNASGPAYLFWSGIFGDASIFAAALTLYFKHNCHHKGCPRVAKHLFEGTPYCTKHLGEVK